MVKQQLTVNSLPSSRGNIAQRGLGTEGQFTENKRLFLEAQKYLVGGVNSPVRAFKAVEGEPIFIKSGNGSRMYSEGGIEFIDYCMAYGPLILGHSHPAVLDALEEAIKNGAVFGTPTKVETELAKAISRAIPSIERIRFTNSGTEAVMTAIRLARAYTKRDKVIKFDGSYHGHGDELLDCQGVPENFTTHTLATPYNDLEGVKAIAEKDEEKIAAIIVEPVAGNMGVVLPKEGFLKGLREISNRYGIVLIFDEVITGFRLCYGGAQNFFNVTPDLTCLGKIIGGGLPAGAVGGSGDIMKLLAPEGEVYQAGTFSGNPLTTNAGLTTLKILYMGNRYDRLKGLTRKLCEGIKKITRERGINMQINFIGSMFSIKYKDFKGMYHALLQEAIYLAPSAEETNFVSLAHEDEDIDETLSAFNKILKKKG